MIRFICALVLSAVSLGAHATPDIYVGTVFDYLDAAQGSYRKGVANNGDSTAFVRVNLAEIVYGDGEPQEIPVHGKAPAADTPELIATPSRLIIPSKGTQTTRLLFMGKREHERYFRLRFVPVVPEKGDLFALPDAEREAYKASFKAGVNVLTGYGAVLIVRPAHTRFDSRIEDTASHYQLTNAGNSTVVLDAVQSCPVGESPECEPSRVVHVMPGKTWRLDKVPGRVVRFKRVEGAAIHPTEVS